MADRLILVDDLDEESIKGVERIDFMWRGTEYEIDLNPEHLAEYDETLAPLLKVARVKQGAGRKGRKTAKPKSEMAAETKKMRDWAKANGHEVPDRGPVPQKVREAYARAQAEPGPSVPPQGAQEDAADPATPHPYAGR
ncbi:Lsr2 family protein [Streptomyces sp. NBC_00237]|uniref:histone-like nucleoid-structuring protein Lsr2 n=1 Tax=Streptomyces sp. NBC_00237 TaxID=2975687 RepID=UPI0022572EB2|nr:Lsr2 family protein [Streptomyces sp. NBC_00237]MCX5207535.1 Lsr2 family protein [Streptomyces sp. NBC_00237]